MLFLGILCVLLTLSHRQAALGLSLDTDVVIISNNDLNPSNPNRTGALLLRTPLSCSRVVLICADLQETLLPTSTGLSSENLSFVLVSDRHGAALPTGSKVWIAGSSGCVAFDLGSSYLFANDTTNPFSTMTRYLLGTNPKYTQGLFSAAILVSDFSTTNPFYSPELVLNTSLTLAKYIGCASDASPSLSNVDAICVQNAPARDLAPAAYDLGLFWDIVIDGDYVLNDIASSIQDGVYARVPTLWSTTECDFYYFLPITLSPTAPPSAYVQTLPRYFSQPQIAKILDTTTLYPYDTAPDEGGMSGAIFTLAQRLTDWVVLCPSMYLAALASNTTNPGNAYHAVFATGLGSPLTPNPSMCRDRVCHADELYWMFGTAETDGLYQPLSAQQIGVTREVMKRFTEMAWSGSPNYVWADGVGGIRTWGTRGHSERDDGCLARVPCGAM